MVGFPSTVRTRTSVYRLTCKPRGWLLENGVDKVLMHGTFRCQTYSLSSTTSGIPRGDFAKPFEGFGSELGFYASPHLGSHSRAENSIHSHRRWH